MYKKIVLACMLLLAGTALVKAQSIQSPNGELKLQFDVKEGIPYYSLSYKDKPVVYDSPMGFELKNSPNLMDSFSIVSTQISDFDETWKPVWGEVKEIRNQYN